MLRKIGLCLLIIGLTGCCQAPASTSSEQYLSELQSLKRHTLKKNPELNKLRYEAMKTVAIGLGAQGALHQMAKLINNDLIRRTTYLDQQFRFADLMLPNRVLPPVLSEGNQLMTLADAYTIRIADQTFIIEQQARFVTNQPTWHDYLWMSFDQPKTPPNDLLPKTPTEQKLWRAWVQEGWVLGERQGRAIFKENMSRLTHDYKGMVLYHTLLQRHQITPPFVSTEQQAVATTDNSLTVNAKKLSLVVLPVLNGNMQSWRPTVS
jgi:defect in organelle trafficking protein DotC